MEVDWDKNSPEKAMIVIESKVDNFRLSSVKRKCSNNNKPTLAISHVGKITVKDIITKDEKVFNLTKEETYSDFGTNLDLEISKFS